MEYKTKLFAIIEINIKTINKLINKQKFQIIKGENFSAKRFTIY